MICFHFLTSDRVFGESSKFNWITKCIVLKTADLTRVMNLPVEKEGNAMLMPQGTDISKVTDGKISKIRRKINARPREKLNFFTPTEVFFKNIL